MHSHTFKHRQVGGRGCIWGVEKELGLISVGVDFVRELGVGPIGIWNHIFRFGPGAHTSLNGVNSVAAAPVATSRGVLPICPTNQDTMMSVLPTQTQRPPTSYHPLQFQSLKPLTCSRIR